MTAQNPYSAPGATLDDGSNALYNPKIFSFSGRIGRMRYLAYSFGITFLVIFMVTLVTGLLTAGDDGGIVNMLGMALLIVAYVAVFLLSLGFARRRFNDLDRSGWWMLAFLVPLVNLLASIYLLFFPGSDGPNRFGPAPTENSTGVLIAGWAAPALFVIGIVAAIALPFLSGMPG